MLKSSKALERFWYIRANEQNLFFETWDLSKRFSALRWDTILSASIIRFVGAHKAQRNSNSAWLVASPFLLWAEDAAAARCSEWDSLLTGSWKSFSKMLPANDSILHDGEIYTFLDRACRPGSISPFELTGTYIKREIWVTFSAVEASNNPAMIVWWHFENNFSTIQNQESKKIEQRSTCKRIQLRASCACSQACTGLCVHGKKWLPLRMKPCPVMPPTLIPQTAYCAVAIAKVRCNIVQSDRWPSRKVTTIRRMENFYKHDFITRNEFITNMNLLRARINLRITSASESGRNKKPLWHSDYDCTYIYFEVLVCRSTNRQAGQH